MKLLKNDSTIVRVLMEEADQSLIIDCIHRTMPKWVPTAMLSEYRSCSETELYMATGIPQDRELSNTDIRIAQEHYTLIAPILPLIGDLHRRSLMITLLSEGTSKQTIRKYLCLYLIYQSVDALAPPLRIEKELTIDEKNMRWALNKFFYNKHKNSLNTAYTLMLKERYCDSYGQLLSHYPTFNQFRYFYRKTKSLQKYYISRDGIKSYQRNNRPLLGDGVQQFAPCVGYGMLDSTICDIYLVDDAGQVVGRPVMTACVDGFSGLCCGYSLSWEGGTYSLRGLMLNIVTDKVAWCREHGVFIKQEEWDSNKMPGVLITDMGAEYKGNTFSQITELGIKLINLTPYRPELKGRVEKFFDLIQSTYKPQLKGKGVIESDYQERGAHDYRKDACLTLQQFEQIILHCIIYYNNHRVTDFPFTENMVKADVKPVASDIFRWGKAQPGANMMDVTPKQLVHVLLPRVNGKFTRKGLIVNGLRYRHDDYTEAFLKGGEATVAYNPDDTTEVFLVENGVYVPFELIETRFDGKDWKSVYTFKNKLKENQQSVIAGNRQAQIDLAEHIQVIASQTFHTNVALNNIRTTRKKEQARTHRDYLKESNKP